MKIQHSSHPEKTPSVREKPQKLKRIIKSSAGKTINIQRKPPPGGNFLTFRQNLLKDLIKTVPFRDSAVFRVLQLLEQHKPLPGSLDHTLSIRILEGLLNQRDETSPDHMRTGLEKLIKVLKQETEVFRHVPGDLIIAEGVENPLPGLPWRLVRPLKEEQSRHTDSGTGESLVLEVNHPDLGYIRSELTYNSSASACVCRFSSSRKEVRRLLRKSLVKLGKTLKEKGFGTVQLAVAAMSLRKPFRNGRSIQGVDLWG